MFYRKYICRVKKKNVDICLCTDGLTYDCRIVGACRGVHGLLRNCKVSGPAAPKQAQIFTLVFAKYGNAL